MSAIEPFGLAKHRSVSGALLSSEVERISAFLRFRGGLLAEGLGGWLVVAHPAVAREVNVALMDDGFRRVALGASLEGLRSVVDLTIEETRMFEVLSPGPLVVARGDGDVSRSMFVAVPDSTDLRDIGSVLGGAAMGFMPVSGAGRAQLEDIFRARGASDRAFSQLGVLESDVGRQTLRELPTVVRITGLNTVDCLTEGALTMDRVMEATTVYSQWEIGDWT